MEQTWQGAFRVIPPKLRTQKADDYGGSQETTREIKEAARAKR